MDVAHAILFAKSIDISRVTADYSSAKFEYSIKRCQFAALLWKIYMNKSERLNDMIRYLSGKNSFRLRDLMER